MTRLSRVPFPIACLILLCHGCADVRRAVPQAAPGSKGAVLGEAIAASDTKGQLTVEIVLPEQATAGVPTIVAARLRNSGTAPLTVSCSVRLSGHLALRGITSTDADGKRDGMGALKIAPRSAASLDWHVVPRRPGEAAVKVTAKGSGQAVTAEALLHVAPGPGN